MTDEYVKPDWEAQNTFKHKLLVNFLLSRNNPLFQLVSSAIWKTITRKAPKKVNFSAPNGIQVYSIGNSHLDSAWKWRKNDSRMKKIYPTFSHNIYYLESGKYPWYYFTANSILHYQWIKADAPELYEKIKRFITEGKWEYVGGDYIEMDVNLPSGESLIRQRLLGQRFYLQEFGKIADIAWMDDVFGFCANLPQIFLKSGSDKFFTNKMGYSRYSINFPPESADYAGGEKFPFLHFNWEAPDGSKVLLSWAQHKFLFYKQLPNFHLHSRLVDPSKKDLKFNYNMNWNEIDKSCTNEMVPLLLNVYGEGDGGMGPKEFELCFMRELNDRKYTKATPIKAFFEALIPYQDRLPTWKDEIYLEDHRGTLTSIAMMKENNHTAEILFQQTENLIVLASLYDTTFEPPNLTPLWEKMLFMQFHDVITGTSIAEVYRDAAMDYNHIYEQLFTIQQQCLTILMQHQPNPEHTIVFNPLEWERTDYFFAPITLITPITSNNPRNQKYQKVSWNFYVNNRQNQLGKVDATGTNYVVERDTHKELERYIDQPKDQLMILVNQQKDDETPQENAKFEELDDRIIFSSSHLRAEISKITGNIVHLQAIGSDSENEFLQNEGISYKLYGDLPSRADAWNIDPNYLEKEMDFPTLKSISIEEEGPLRFTVLVEYNETGAGSKFYARYAFLRNETQVYGETLVDWHEDHVLCKLSIESNLDSETVNCGTPYFIQKRATNPRTVYQKAMYEFSFQEFVFWQTRADQPEQKTIAFFSQNKNGMSAQGNRIGISLLKSASFSHPVTQYASLDDDFESRTKIMDQGFHRIPWMIEVFDHKVSNATIVRKAYEYNNPLITTQKQNQISFDENLEFIPFLISTSSDQVIISSIKMMEPPLPDKDEFYQLKMDEIGVIVRLISIDNQSIQAKVSIGESYNKIVQLARVIEVDLLERYQQSNIELATLKLGNNGFEASLNPFEIKSYLFILNRII